MNSDRQNSRSRLLIAGTGHGVGKSLVAAAIAAYRQTCDQPPVTALTLSQESVGTLDMTTAWQSLQVASSDAVPEPAPVSAPGSESGTVSGLLTIEAPGSLGTPVTYETTVADLARDWRLDTLLVAAVSPDCLGELTAHAALAKQSRCSVKGIILNCLTAEAEENWEAWASPRQVAALTQLTYLGRIPHLTRPTEIEQLAAAGAELDLPA